MQKKLRMRLLLLTAGCLIAATLGEVLYRWIRTSEPESLMFFRSAEGLDLVPGRLSPEQQLAFRCQIQATWPRADLPPFVPTVPAVGEYAEWFGSGYPMPRDLLDKNVTWRPGSRFFICYRGPQQPYFDEHGCVEYKFNQFGIRDREDLTLEKPPGVRRVVCLGDSLTLGWGVRQQANWPVLVEQELRAHRNDGQPAVQVINCGGAGSSYADEYELALRHRYGRFDPDLVLVSLCLNDLVITNGKLCQYRPEALGRNLLPADETRWWMGSQLLFDLSRSLAQSSALTLDPERDWVQELIDLPADHLWYRHKDETPAIYWRGGAPQRALLGIRDWCRQHGAVPAVVIWPLLQGLGPDDHYPFLKLHEMVAAFCEAEGLACFDLLEVLTGQPEQELWVSPADMHPNERAQELVAPALAAFVADLLDSK